MVEAGELTGPVAEATVAASLAALLGERDADGESIFPRPPGATIDTLLLGCTHYPLLRPIIEDIVGERVAIVGFGDGHGVRPGRAAERERARGAAAAATPASHRQLTTGDRRRFAELAGRLFGTDFPDVESVELGVLASMTRRERRASWRDDRAWQAGHPHRLGGRAPPRPSSGGAWNAPRARDSSTGRPSSDSRSAAWPRRPGTLSAGELRRGRAGLRRGDGAASCRRCRPRSGRSCPASSSAPASSIGPAGCAPTPRRSRRSSASSRRTCSTRSCRPAAASPRRRSRSRTAGSRPASSGCCSASWASACSASTTSRCCRPRRPPAGCCSSRRTSARPRAPSACRSGRSGPGSPCTRRPTPSSSRRTPGCGRTSRRASSGS